MTKRWDDTEKEIHEAESCSEFRIEKDSLGEIQVPIGALYGAQTQRAVNNFPISGLKPWPMFIRSMALIKGAAAKVNADLGWLNPDISAAIQTAADEVLAGKWDDQFVVDPFQAGAGTSHNMNMNEVLANRARQVLINRGITEKNVHPNDHVNMAQSTNDVIPTAIRLGCLMRLDELTAALQNLTEALANKAIEFDDVIKSGRTHLQDAVPIRMGQEFEAYAEAVRKDISRIKYAANTLGELGIGGTAVGSGLNAHPEYHDRMVSELVKRSGLVLYRSENLFERMQSMADMADFSASLRTTALTLIRIANDFRLLASGPATGLDELKLPALQPGSSIMPGKVNPVEAEMLNMAMFHIIGCDTTVSYAVQAGQLELNVMMPIIAHELFESMQVMIGAVNAFTEKCVRGLEANRKKASGWLEKNAIIVTALNPLIGYQQGAALVKRSIKEGRSIREIALEKAQEKVLFKKDSWEPISPEVIEKALSDLRSMTENY